jgi:hypothetical protein
VTKIYFDTLKVGELSQSSGIFSGENRQRGWRDVRSSKQSFGSVGGNHNKVKDSVHMTRKRRKT